jgi:hypothetical protein
MFLMCFALPHPCNQHSAGARLNQLLPVQLATKVSHALPCLLDTAPAPPRHAHTPNHPAVSVIWLDKFDRSRPRSCSPSRSSSVPLPPLSLLCTDTWIHMFSFGFGTPLLHQKLCQGGPTSGMTHTMPLPSSNRKPAGPYCPCNRGRQELLPSHSSFALLRALWLGSLLRFRPCQ